MSSASMLRVRRLVRILAHIPLSVLILPLVLGSVLRRRLRGSEHRPRVLFGITPIINIKYWSQALRTRGYVSDSLVYDVYAINRREDFDHHIDGLFPRLSRNRFARQLQPYAAFLWSISRYDVLVLDFDGGCLRGTPLASAEFPLRRAAGQHVVAIPYGADVIDIRRCAHAPTRAALLAYDPDMSSRAGAVRRRVNHYARWASHIVCTTMMIDYLPRFDSVVVSPIAIDTDAWSPSETDELSPEVTILHAPNHRTLKGTELLVRACDELRREGLPIRLVIRERAPNEEIREAMRNADIVASAFVMGYYELFAIEGMSMGKPVLNYWRPDLFHMHSLLSFASDCPIVDAPPELLKERIRMLAVDPQIRRRLGSAGRDYVLRHHSYEAVGAMLEELVNDAWAGGGRR
ncbi:MAG TPA: hypothetical protein VFM96_07395 [Gaiellaceae bacterium]|nr:hypothetical protein [Gaiellaceae bacterium]